MIRSLPNISRRQIQGLDGVCNDLYNDLGRDDLDDDLICGRNCLQYARTLKKLGS